MGLRLLSSAFGAAESVFARWRRESPTYFSAGCLLSAALCLGVITRASTDGLRVYWWVLCLGFLYMSVDEAVQLHETIVSTASQYLFGKFKFPGFRQPWVPLALVAALVLAPFCAYFLWRLPRWYAVRFASAGALYVLAAVGLEIVEGMLVVRQADVKWLLLNVHLEESLETFAIICFIHALLHYLSRLNLRVQLDFAETAGTPAATPVGDGLAVKSR